MFKVCMKLVRRLLHIFLSFYVLRVLLAAVQLRRKNWHFSAFRTLSSPCTHPSVSLTVLLWGNKGPLLTHLEHTHIHFLSISVYHSCSNHFFIRLSALLPCISGVFDAREAAVRVTLWDRLASITWAVARWTGMQTARLKHKKHRGNEIKMLLCDHPKSKSLNSVNKAYSSDNSFWLSPSSFESIALLFLENLFSSSCVI